MIRCAVRLSTVPRCQYFENCLVAAMESEAVDDVIWLLQVLRCEKTRWQEVTFEEYKWLKIRRKQFLRKKHPDKARDDSAKFECTKLNQRFNNAWDELNKRLPPGWVSAPGTEEGQEDARESEEPAGSATPAAGGGRESSDNVSACPLTPHVQNFDRKYGHLGTMKQQESKFLFSAQNHCVACMSFYSATQNINIRCTSQGKTARGWAATSMGRSRRTVTIPPHVESWLGAHGL